jgi:hypothetical protein
MKVNVAKLSFDPAKKTLSFVVSVNHEHLSVVILGLRLMNGYIQPPATSYRNSWFKQARLGPKLADAVYTLLHRALTEDADPLQLGPERKNVVLEERGKAIKRLLPDMHALNRLVEGGAITDEFYPEGHERNPIFGLPPDYADWPVATDEEDEYAAAT